MRIASALAVGAAVTTAVFVVRTLSERDDSGSKSIGDPNGESGTTDPTPTPTQKRPPPLAPGEVLTISLSTKPSSYYREIESADAYTSIAETASDGRGIYDSALSRAAREIAIASAIHQDVAPEPLTTFILHSSGAPDSTSARFSLHTNDEGEEVVARAIDEALSAPPRGPGDLIFGVGEADTPSEVHSRRIIVVMVRRAFRLDQTPRRAELDSTWEARGELPVGFRDATSKVLYPDGRLADGDLSVSGRRFRLRVDTGNVAGQLQVGIDGTGERGPGKLMQISVEVGQPLPREFSVVVPPLEPAFDTIEAAEAHAVKLLALDREAFGVPALILDPDLTAIARGHSEEMASAGFFGHQSPTTGLAGDRIEDAGYRAVAFAENLAKNDNLAEAESSLLGSVGHRANLLGRQFTHVGVGVARKTERGRNQWYVTQLFARKTVNIDEAEFTNALYAKVAEARAGSGLDELEIEEALETVARDGARLAANRETKDIAKKIGRTASDAAGRSVSVTVQVLYDAAQFEVPETVVDGKTQTIGIGVSQSESDRAGRIGVVVISGRRR